MEKLETDTYPINIDKMMIFIQVQKDRDLEYNSLKCCISAIFLLFRSNCLTNITLGKLFINFHKGNLRDTKAYRNPNEKEPWNPSFFDSYISVFLKYSKPDPLGKGTDTFVYDN